LAQLKKYNIDVEEASGERKHHMLPVSAVFMVARNGLIQFEYVNPDYKVRLDPEPPASGGQDHLQEIKERILRRGSPGRIESHQREATRKMGVTVIADG
jgi:hypothetical protein